MSAPPIIILVRPQLGENIGKAARAMLNFGLTEMRLVAPRDGWDDAGRMKPSSYYERIVDVMEELVRFTVLLRPHAEQLVDRYSERVETDRPVATVEAILDSLGQR